MELPLTSALLLLLPLLCFLWLRRDTRRQSRSDGLKAYPIIGTLPHFVKNQHRLIEWSAGVLARCPTYTMTFNFRGLGLGAGVMTANPANVEHVAKANFQNYPKGEFVWAWRLQRLLNVGPERRMRDAVATIHGYIDRAVRERGERGAAAGLARKDDFLSRFASSGEHSDEGLRDVVTNFIVAGRDTTSSALSWFFWVLSGRPDVEDKIVREVRAARASSGEGSFGYEELRSMQYLQAAITESMRLYPPVAMDTHCCQREDVLPDGTLVGKGWQVTYSAYAMARLEELWGADCAEFRPERWLDEEGAFRPESTSKYPVFHAGPRMCLGKEMAYIQMKSIVAGVLERFSLRHVGGEGHPRLVMSLTLRMGGGLPMQVKSRGS
uniref:Cytochrome P450 94A2 n=1 Tax=Aegilops tauschii TaxID=37682 RepID=M8CF56_AEGTA